MKKHHSYIIVFGLIIFLVFWSMALFVIGPDAIVGKIGVRNVYLVVFLIGLFGGLSSATVAPFFATLVTAAAGGADPLFLALFGGVALTVSDSVFYYLAWKGRDILGGNLRVWAEKIRIWVDGKPRWLPQIVCLVYTSITPFPTDILMVAMALARVSFKRIVVFVLLGNITLICIISTISGWI